MSTARPAPAWLAAFQRQFSDALRAPLCAKGGALRPDPSAYAPSLCEGVSPRRAPPGPAEGARGQGAAELAVYNRQYWVRLFRVLQGEFPLTARLLGLWAFNQAAQAFLIEHPPRHADLGRAADGFSEALTSALASPHRLSPAASLSAALASPHAPPPSALPRAALAEAARLDEAWRSIWAAPEQPAWRPTPDDAARFEGLRLRRSEAAALVSEGWPLLELRHTLASDEGEGAVPLPPPHKNTRHWALCRADDGLLRWPLNPTQARLLELLAERPVGQALGQLEAETPGGERGRLTEQVRAWLAQSVRVGFWAGASEEPNERTT